MTSYIWFDGTLQKEVSVPFLSHSLHYGSTVFDGMRYYDTPDGPAIFLEAGEGRGAAGPVGG